LPRQRPTRISRGHSNADLDRNDPNSDPNEETEEKAVMIAARTGADDRAILDREAPDLQTPDLENGGRKVAVETAAVRKLAGQRAAVRKSAFQKEVC
jgi:hypothetical protein